MRFLVRHNRHHKVSQSVPHFMSRKTVTTFLRIKVGGHFVISIVKCYESHYVGVLDNPRCSTVYVVNTRTQIIFITGGDNDHWTMETR